MSSSGTESGVGGRSPTLALTGKRALITGTGRGQGEVIQRVFASLGAKVVGCDFVPGSAEASAEALRNEGHDVWGKTVDLGDADAAKEWVDWAALKLGGVDILFNNAGAPRMANFSDMTLDDWRFTIRNELDLVFYATHAAWPHLLKVDSGCVISTASVSGKIGWGSLGQVAHCAAKGGVLAFTKQLAAEGGKVGIRVNTVSPGFVRTPGTEGPVSEDAETYIRKTMQLDPRPTLAQDIAHAAAFLASDVSRGVTGGDIAVDAGWTAGRP
ncbi:hypothetical protein MMC08_005189 [Hypocenomyce scalaris]|nr:hypothetical protein [Hypocenomyce scalaris]